MHNLAKRVFTEEHKKNMRENHIGTKGHKLSDEHKKKIGEKGKGRLKSKEHKKKIGEKMKETLRQKREGAAFATPSQALPI